MKLNKLKFVISILLVALLLTGCIGVDRSFRNIRDYVLNSSNNQFEREIEFALGSVTISMAELVLDFTDIEEPINEVLSEISSVQIGIYNNFHNKTKSGFNDAKFLTKKMESIGWERIILTLNKNEMVAIFVRTQNNKLNQLFVISANREKVVLAEILGNLHKVVEIAIREKGFDFAMNH